MVLYGYTVQAVLAQYITICVCSLAHKNICGTTVIRKTIVLKSLKVGLNEPWEMGGRYLPVWRSLISAMNNTTVNFNLICFCDINLCAIMNFNNTLSCSVKSSLLWKIWLNDALLHYFWLLRIRSITKRPRRETKFAFIQIKYFNLNSVALTRKITWTVGSPRASGITEIGMHDGTHFFLRQVELCTWGVSGVMNLIAGCVFV